MTVLVATSVIRGSEKGASHGAVQVLDMAGGRVAHVIDWKAPGVDWSAPNGGRGLRGIAFDGERVFIAGADTLFAFSPEFELLATYRCPYLSQCQEITIYERRLYLASRGFDSVLGFDLEDNRFGWGLHVVEGGGGLHGTPFDPLGSTGPSPGEEMGLSSLWCDPRGMFISGSKTRGLLYFDARSIVRLVTLPEGVRNARPWRDGVLFNDTEAGVARFITPVSNQVFKLPRYPVETLTALEESHNSDARQGFARGLCVLDDSVFAAGSSPASVTLHNLDTMKTTRNINFSNDVRQSVHSLAVWPYPVPE